MLCRNVDIRPSHAFFITYESFRTFMAFCNVYQTISAAVCAFSAFDSLVIVRSLGACSTRRTELSDQSLEVCASQHTSVWVCVLDAIITRRAVIAIYFAQAIVAELTVCAWEHVSFLTVKSGLANGRSRWDLVFCTSFAPVVAIFD